QEAGVIGRISRLIELTAGPVLVGRGRTGSPGCTDRGLLGVRRLLRRWARRRAEGLGGCPVAAEGLRGCPVAAEGLGRCGVAAVGLRGCLTAESLGGCVRGAPGGVRVRCALGSCALRCVVLWGWWLSTAGRRRS